MIILLILALHLPPHFFRGAYAHPYARVVLPDCPLWQITYKKMPVKELIVFDDGRCLTNVYGKYLGMSIRVQKVSLFEQAGEP